VFYSLQDHLRTEMHDLDYLVLAGAENTDTLPNELCKNPNAITKGLMKQVRVNDELLEQ
jgi:hypothetical protein